MRSAGPSRHLLLWSATAGSPRHLKSDRVHSLWTEVKSCCSQSGELKSVIWTFMYLQGTFSLPHVQVPGFLSAYPPCRGPRLWMPITRNLFPWCLHSRQRLWRPEMCLWSLYSQLTSHQGQGVYLTHTLQCPEEARTTGLTWAWRKVCLFEEEKHDLGMKQDLPNGSRRGTRKRECYEGMAHSVKHSRFMCK